MNPAGLIPTQSEIKKALAEKWGWKTVNEARPLYGDLKVVVYDVETLRLASEVGGWSNKVAMGIACLVVYHASEDRWEIITDYEYRAAKEQDRLKDFQARVFRIFEQADVLMSVNGVIFDNIVLESWTNEDFSKFVKKCMDPSYEVYRKHGLRETDKPNMPRVGLKSLAKQLRIPDPKTMNGVEAVMSWRTQDINLQRKVIEYCVADVFGTMLVLNTLIRHKSKIQRGKCTYGFKYYNSAEDKRRISSLEALALLHSKLKGLVSPATEAALVSALTFYCLRTYDELAKLIGPYLKDVEDQRIWQSVHVPDKPINGTCRGELPEVLNQYLIIHREEVFGVKSRKPAQWNLKLD